MNDENRELGKDLPHKEFVATRQEIVNLLSRMSPGLKFESDELNRNLIDLYVDNIGVIWKNYYSPPQEVEE